MELVVRLFLSIFLWLLVGCTPLPESRTTEEIELSSSPDDFLKTLNQFAPFAAGNYSLVITTDAIISGAVSIGVQSALDADQWDTTLTSYNVSVTNDVDAASFDFSVSAAGGLILDIQAPEGSKINLLKDESLIYMWQVDISGETYVDFPSQGTSSLEYALAYYAAVDPDDDRTTLAAWKTLNGFDAGYDTNVLFRDARDLGYGREMYGRKNGDGSIAIFVNNYQVQVGEDDSGGYGPLNINPAYEKDSDYLIGTNAIEFSPLNYKGSVEMVPKFFTFLPDPDPSKQARVLSADLDGRGQKAVPGTCLICHGATLLPLEADGSMPLSVLRSAKFNQIEVEQVEYLDIAGYRRTDQEGSLKTLNSWVHESYETMAARPVSNAGHWQADYAIDVLEGRYDGAGLPATTYSEDYIPLGWRQTAFRPEGIETLYKQVIEPHCINCHSLRGRSSGEAIISSYAINGQNVSLANAINFNSFEQFISFNDRIIDYVYKRGVMPLSLRNFEKFWSVPTGEPTTLAAFLTGFDGFNSDGSLIEPGIPIARMGEYIQGTSPLTLDGGLSLFADEFQWQIIDKPINAITSFSSPNSARTTLNADTSGDYIVELAIQNDFGTDSLQFDVEIETTASVPGSLNFIDDIAPLIQATFSCSGCHTTTAIDGIPVHYNALNLNVYSDILARINLAKPDLSLLLQKPTQYQHGGGIVINKITNELEFRTMLEWIRQGAPCGDDINICAQFQNRS